MNENLHGRINQWGQKAGLGHIMVLCATCIVVRLGGISWGSFWEDTNCFDSCSLTQVWWCSRENRNLIDVIKRNKRMKHSRWRGKGLAGPSCSFSWRYESGVACLQSVPAECYWHPASSSPCYTNIMTSVPQGAASRDLYSTLSWTSFGGCWPPAIVLYLRKNCSWCPHLFYHIRAWLLHLVERFLI